MLHIKVPATSANMGSGIDSIGIALKMYNHLWFEEIDEGLEIIIKKEQPIKIPTDKNNLLYKTMSDFYDKIGKKMPGVRLIQEDNIPLTRGLGSSAACIVAGLMAANHMSGCFYSKEELAQMAAQIEGHPDNSNPAILGGMVVGALDEKKMQYVQLSMPYFLTFAVMVPDFPVPTERSRQVLPDSLSRGDAIFNSSRAALLVASMITGNLDNLKMAMEDKIHQPYRSVLIPNMDNIFKKSEEFGASAAYLSGAGPTLIAVLQDSKVNLFEEKMNEYLSTLPNNWTLTMVKPDFEGATIVNE